MKKKSWLLTTFVLYLIVVAFLTIVPVRIVRLSTPVADHINLVPFRYTFKCLWSAYRVNHELMGFCLRHTLGNIALLMPLGIFLPLTTVRFRSFSRVVAMALCLSVSIEIIQFLLRFIGSPRAVDIDDVLLNTVGAAIGFLIYRESKVQSPRSKVR